MRSGRLSGDSESAAMSPSTADLSTYTSGNRLLFASSCRRDRATVAPSRDDQQVSGRQQEGENARSPTAALIVGSTSCKRPGYWREGRSEEHTSELQSR